jgi:hypothetical protein
MLYQRQSQPQSAKRKSKDGDWICIQCFNYNYAFRDYCKFWSLTFRQPMSLSIAQIKLTYDECYRQGKLRIKFISQCSLLDLPQQVTKIRTVGAGSKSVDENPLQIKNV